MLRPALKHRWAGLWGHFIITGSYVSLFWVTSVTGNGRWFKHIVGKDDDPEEQDDEDAGHRRCEI